MASWNCVCYEVFMENDGGLSGVRTEEEGLFALTSSGSNLESTWRPGGHVSPTVSGGWRGLKFCPPKDCGVFSLVDCGANETSFRGQHARPEFQ